MGYRFEAKALSEDNHRLPIPPSALGETDFSKVYRKIRSLLPTTEFDGSKPFVFTSVEETTSEETNIEVLKSFIAQMSGDRRNPIEIMPLARLLYALMEKLASVGRAASIGNVNIARTILSSTRFDYTSGISCNYHEEIDEMQRCTLARATRYALLLSSNVCRPLGVQLVLGKHLAPSTKSILQTKSLTQSMSCFSFSTDESESEARIFALLSSFSSFSTFFIKVIDCRSLRLDQLMTTTIPFKDQKHQMQHFRIADVCFSS